MKGTLYIDGEPIAEVTGIEIRQEDDRMAKFKVGDKVRITDDTIPWRSGLVGEVIEDDGSTIAPYLVKLTNGEERWKYGENLELVKEDEHVSYKTEKRKARVGERILITDAGVSLGYYTNGDVFTVIKDRGQYGVDIKEKPNCPYILDKEYEVIVEEAPDLSARVTELERKVAALEAVLADKSKLSTAQRIITHMDANGADYYRKLRFPTPNQRRADVIKQAREFVAKYSGIVKFDRTPLTEGCGDVRTEFVVNTEKRTVVALGHLAHTGGIVKKGIAKCAPGDVFNADIGKAIAAGRMYGVKVPDVFFNAPKPTEVVVGHRFEVTEDGRITGQTGVITKFDPLFDGGRGKAFRHSLDSGWLGEKQVTIIDDTEAQY